MSKDPYIWNAAFDKGVDKLINFEPIPSIFGRVIPLCLDTGILYRNKHVNNISKEAHKQGCWYWHTALDQGVD